MLRIEEKNDLRNKNDKYCGKKWFKELKMIRIAGRNDFRNKKC